MHNKHLPQLSWRFLVVFGSILGSILPQTGIAADANGQLFFRPHCELTDETKCVAFSTLDPKTLITPALAVGDTLDLDLVFQNTPAITVSRIRAWIAYDPDVLQGATITPGTTLTIPTPGEMDFVEQKGYAKVQVSSDQPKTTGPIFTVAHIVFRVKSVPAGGLTAISFYDLKADASGHTFVAMTNEAAAQNYLARDQGSLRIAIAASVSSSVNSSSIDTNSSNTNSSAETAVTSSSLAATEESSSSITPTPEETPTEPSEPTRTSFILLQIQNVTITTDGTTIYVAWDNLRSSELNGYNVYYGTKSGQYLQRKSVAGGETTLAIRGLPEGSTYYVAVRGFNAAGEESAFSQEVAVKVGDPSSSTSPMIRKNDNEKAPPNPLVKGTKTTTSVPGESGLPSPLLLLVLLSAIIGTMFALRKQWKTDTSHFTS